MIHGSDDNIIRNNIFALARDTQLGDGGSKRNIFERNIVYGDSGRFFYDNWTHETAAMDYNLYFDPRRKPVFPDGKSFEDWQHTGQDAHSIIADPLFVNTAKDDYSLRPDSPALKLGFKPIDISRVGLMWTSAAEGRVWERSRPQVR